MKYTVLITDYALPTDFSNDKFANKIDSKFKFVNSFISATSLTSLLSPFSFSLADSLHRHHLLPVNCFSRLHLSSPLKSVHLELVSVIKELVSLLRIAASIVRRRRRLPLNRK
ncbi:hypothetical protein HN51_011188 [Arachis hypogaea]